METDSSSMGMPLSRQPSSSFTLSPRMEIERTKNEFTDVVMPLLYRKVSLIHQSSTTTNSNNNINSNSDDGYHSPQLDQQHSTGEEGISFSEKILNNMLKRCIHMRIEGKPVQQSVWIASSLFIASVPGLVNNKPLLPFKLVDILSVVKQEGNENRNSSPPEHLLLSSSSSTVNITHNTGDNMHGDRALAFIETKTSSTVSKRIGIVKHLIELLESPDVLNNSLVDIITVENLSVVINKVKRSVEFLKRAFEHSLSLFSKFNEVWEKGEAFFSEDMFRSQSLRDISWLFFSIARHKLLGLECYDLSELFHLQIAVIETIITLIEANPNVLPSRKRQRNDSMKFSDCFQASSKSSSDNSNSSSSDEKNEVINVMKLQI